MLRRCQHLYTTIVFAALVQMSRQCKSQNIILKIILTLRTHDIIKSFLGLCLCLFSCCNRIDWAAYKQQIYLSQFWRLRSARSRCWQIGYWWGPSSLSMMGHQLCPHVVEWAQEVLRSFSKGYYSYYSSYSWKLYPLDPVTFQRPYLKILFYWGLGRFHVRILGGTQTFRI